MHCKHFLAKTDFYHGLSYIMHENFADSLIKNTFLSSCIQVQICFLYIYLFLACLNILYLVPCVLCFILQVVYDFNPDCISRPSMTHHVLPYSIQGGSKFVVSQPRCSLPCVDLGASTQLFSSIPKCYDDSVRHSFNVRTSNLHPAITIPQIGFLEHVPVDLSDHKMQLVSKEDYEQYIQSDLMSQRYASSVNKGMSFSIFAMQ